MRIFRTYLFVLSRNKCSILQNEIAHCKIEKKGDHFWMDCL